MKNKKILKQVLALMCSVTLLVGGIVSLANSGLITLNTLSVAEQLEADGYIRVTPENFGITGEVEHTYASSSISKTYSGSTSYLNKKAYFDADISLTAGGLDTNYVAYLNQYLLRVYISGTTLVLYSTANGNKLLCQTNLSTLGISTGEYFNLKLATDMTTDNAYDSTYQDVKVQMWVNNSPVTLKISTITVSDAHAKGTNFYVRLSKTGTIKVKPVVEEETEDSTTTNVPEELAEYTKITPENFGITEEVVHTYASSTIDKTYSGSTSLNGKNVYFDADISLTAAGMDTGYIAYLNKYLLRIYVVGTSVTVYSPTAEKVLFQINLSTLEGTVGEYFNLKFATSMTENTSNSANTDITVQMWVNNNKVNPSSTDSNKITVGDAYANGTNLYVGLSTSGTIKIKPVVEEETEEPEVPDVPAELEGYTKITPENFGITEEVVHTYDSSAISKTYSGSTSLNGTNAYFDADISLTAAGMNTGYIAYLNEYLLRIYVVGSDVTVYSPTAEKVLFQTNLSTLEGTVGEYFNLKFATSMTENTSNSANTDITVQMWVNNNKVNPSSTDSNKMTVGDAYANGTNLYVGLSTAGTIKIKPVVEETEEPEEPIVPEEPVVPNIPEELVGFTRITPKTFGITKPVVHTYASSKIDKTYSGSTSLMDTKAYFDADISLTDAGMDTGYIAYLNKYFLRIYINGTTLYVYSNVAATPVLFKTNIATVGGSVGEYFNIKLATEMTESTNTANTDVTVQLWINNNKVDPATTGSNIMTVADGYAQGTNLYVGLSTAGTIKIKSHVEVAEEQGKRLSDVVYKLSSTSGYLLTCAGDIFVDGEYTDVGTVLTTPGTYVIQKVVSEEEIYIQNVSLYKVGDVNLGGGEEWTKDDQADLEEILNKGTTSQIKMKAADINNDGKVAKSDLALMKKVVKSELEEDAVIAKYHAPAVTYDFLGGDSVMPIGGYYGPYNEATVTDAMYKLIADSGVNLIVKSAMDYSDTSKQELIQKGLAYAEKYGIGMFVNDARLNTITTDEDGNVSAHSYISDATELATLLGDYSSYQSFLGNMIVDEPIANQEDGWTGWNADKFNRFKWYEGITTALNSYDNLTGYVNLLGQHHMQTTSGKVYMDYENYLRTVGKGMKLLSFDSYPFFEKQGVSGGLTPYLKSLGTVSKVAREDGYPFWSYVQAGTDYRDDASTGATTGYLTKAQTLWNVNTSLAFGAKGIVYFPLVQPSYFANVAEGTYDYNRNGIIGADNKTNNYYEMVQTANQQVTAVDEVLMKSINQGVVVTGQAQTDATDVENIIASTDKLTSVSGDDAMVGCFTYQDTEAFYVVSYDYAASEEQTITLHFDGNHQYRLIQGGATTYGEGSTCTITASAGEGVLVVLVDHVVYYEDISAYRAESGYTAPEAPTGYVFAGWYKDKACTKENAVKKGETEVAAYAKFVDANLLTVKAQITAGTTADSTSTSIRFVTSVNDKNYTKNGFKINIYKPAGVDERDYSDNIVYKTLSVKVDEMTTEHTPQKLFCATATYFKAQIINNIPQANFDTEFEVTPYWETLDGTIVLGTTATKTVRQGIK